MRTYLSLCALAALLSGCASGSSQAPPKSASVPAAGDVSTTEVLKNINPDGITCARDRKIGSHMKKTICMTALQREEAAKRNQETVERAKMREAGGGAANQ